MWNACARSSLNRRRARHDAVYPVWFSCFWTWVQTGQNRYWCAPYATKTHVCDTFPTRREVIVQAKLDRRSNDAASLSWMFQKSTWNRRILRNCRKCASLQWWAQVEMHITHRQCWTQCASHCAWYVGHLCHVICDARCDIGNINFTAAVKCGTNKLHTQTRTGRKRENKNLQSLTTSSRYRLSTPPHINMY